MALLGQPPLALLLEALLSIATILVFSVHSLYGEQFIGQRLKVTGQLQDGYLTAIRIQTRDSKKDPKSGRVEGSISAINPERSSIRIGPFEISVTRATQLENMSLEDLTPGHTVRAIVHLDLRGHLVASSLEPAAAAKGYIKIIGHVFSSFSEPDGTVWLKILGVAVKMPQDVYNRGLSLIRRPDDKRPDKQLTVPVLGHPLVIGGEFGNTSRFRGDFKLKDHSKDDKVRLDQEFQLELFYRFARNVSLFLEGKSLSESVVFDQSGDRRNETAVERGETWLYLGNLFGSGFSLQIGRQDFREKREWWWDEDLDAVRLYFSRRRFYAELAVAKELAGVSTLDGGIDPEQRDILRILGRLSWSWRPKQRLDWFFLRHHDFSNTYKIGERVAEDREDPSDADLFWGGLRFSGDLDLGRIGDVSYWLDGAGVGGHETLYDFQETSRSGNRVTARTVHTVLAWALDSGVSWESKLPLRPTFTFGYAVGSGDDDPGDKTDGNFRQTGLQDNNNRFNGVDRFRYYGELFRPELSNLRIWMGALGFRFWRSSSIEFVYHKYQQVHAAPFLRSARIKADPVGTNSDIGDEWDVVLGLEEWQRIELEIVGGLFRSGKAYGPLAGELASNVVFKFNFNF
ncbi:MAG: alginate export family protein [bacterium]